MGFGRNVLGVIGSSFSLSDDGKPQNKLGAAQLDWATFAAVGSDTTVPFTDGMVCPSGSKFCRLGQVICRITGTSNGGTVGKFGPYDPAATDGRQSLVRGDCFLVNRAVVSNDPRAEFPEAINGGKIWLARVLQSGTATHTLALGPTLAEVEAAFPEAQWVKEAS
jgi:hypothetical protein